MTSLIRQWRQEGDQTANDKLNRLIFDTLKPLANNQMYRERADHTLQATVLVNDAYMQLVPADVSFADSAHFRAVAAKMMRRTLIDHAREKNAQKRGGGQRNLTLMESRLHDNGFSPDVLELDEALKQLAAFDERAAQVIELTFFGGLNYAEVAEVVGISKATVERDLRIGKAWLYKQLTGEP